MGSSSSSWCLGSCSTNLGQGCGVRSTCTPRFFRRAGSGRLSLRHLPIPFRDALRRLEQLLREGSNAGRRLFPQQLLHQRCKTGGQRGMTRSPTPAARGGAYREGRAQDPQHLPRPPRAGPPWPLSGSPAPRTAPARPSPALPAGPRDADWLPGGSAPPPPE